MSLEVTEHRSSQDYIEINVGGTTFYCSKVTLCSASTYFQARLSGEWKDEEGLFLDQDPASFQVLLNFMRHGFIKASEITDFVLIQAEFFGMNLLLKAVKCAAYRYMNNNCESQKLKTEADDYSKFDSKYGGILSAIKNGILPRNIRPSITGHTEYVHLGISAHATVIPSGPNEDKFLPCLMTKLVGPPHLADILDALLPHDNPNSYSTLIESMNWLHKHGFVTREDTFSHNYSDIFDDQPADQTFMQLFDHAWFSRIVNEDAAMGDSWESPIIYDQHPLSYEGPAQDRRQFAALVSLTPNYQLDPMQREFAIAGSKMPKRLDVSDDGSGIGGIRSRTSCVIENPVNWLGKEGYTREEKSLGHLYETMFRKGCEKCYLWDEETIKRIHVKVFSRQLWERGDSLEQGDSNAEVHMDAE
jgi:hypothetical protein